jgi:hypothetical protein
MSEVVIVAAARTAVGKFGGTIAKISAAELGAHVIKGLVDAKRKVLVEELAKNAVINRNKKICVKGDSIPINWKVSSTKHASVGCNEGLILSPNSQGSASPGVIPLL